MKKWLILVVMALFSVGISMILINMRHYQQRSADWVNNIDKVAADMCKPDETFRVTKTTSNRGRTYFDYYCDDTQGNTNNLVDELDAAGPSIGDLKTTFAGVGITLVAALLAYLATPRQKRDEGASS
ncbi:MAG: hypothetical protein HY862_06915 [Chloroflexi bacterium]|nr:hypothetical protein [Chloroflexota bacterium]